jgi:hypothetical protein
MLKSAIALNVFQPQKVTDPYIYYSLSFLSLFFRSTLILLFFLQESLFQHSGKPVDIIIQVRFFFPRFWEIVKTKKS